MNLCTSTFAYVYSIGLYKRIVNAVTQSIRIANADGQGVACILTDVKETVVTENFYQPIPVSILKYYMPNGLI